jgi:hypothetical protein
MRYLSGYLVFMEKSCIMWNSNPRITLGLISALSILTFAAIGVSCSRAEYEVIQPAVDGNPRELLRSKLARDTFTANSYSPLEILFAVDTSSSLKREREWLQENMKKFIDSFSGDGFKGVHITVLGDSSLSTDTDECPRTNEFEFPPSVGNVTRVGKCVSSYNAISRLQEYYHRLSPNLAPEASLEAIIISDDDGKGVGNLAKDFDPMVGSRKVRVSAIVGIPDVTVPNADCRLAHYGEEHIALAESTNGQTYDICNKDWSALIKSISSEIRTTNHGYNLTSRVDPTKEYSVTVNGEPLAKEYYSIDPERSFLIIKDGYPIPNGAKIEVIYYTPTTK